MYKGIDVSKHNGQLNWDSIKNDGIQFAIIRLGYGSDIQSQDDKQFENNVSACERLGIPYGVYLYSYALSVNDAKSEVDHTLRVLGSRKPSLGCYFDMEDADGYKRKHGINVYNSRQLLTDICNIYCASINASGIKCGIYASKDYWNNVLYKNQLAAYTVWLAQWGVEAPSFDCELWQCTSDGVVNGSSARTDMDYFYGSLDGSVQNTVQNNGNKKSNDEVANEVISGAWGSGDDRKNKLAAAGYDYNVIQAIVNTKLNATSQPVKKSNDQIATEVIAGAWGSGDDRKNKLAAAGYDYNTIQNIVNQKLGGSTKPASSAVCHTIKSGETLSAIAKNNGTTVSAIMKLNPSITNANKIFAGQKIRIK